MESLFPPIPDRMSFEAYPYTAARVSAMKSTLLREEDYQKLLKMRPAEIGKFLEEQDYKQEIDALAVQYSGVELLNAAVDQHFGNIVAKLRRIANEEFVLLMDVYLIRRDIANLKTILRGKSQRHTPEQIKVALQPGGVLSNRARDELIACETVEQVLAYLPALGLNGFPKGDLPVIEQALDVGYYEKLLAFAKQFPSQGQLFADFLLTELDNRNLFTVLRLRQANIRDIERHLLPSGKRYRRQLLLHLATLSDEALIKELAMRNVDLKSTIEELEVQHAKALLNSAMLLLHQNPLSVDVLLGYLFAKEIEIRNLRTIIMGKHLGMDEAFITANLVIGG